MATSEQGHTPSGHLTSLVPSATEETAWLGYHGSRMRLRMCQRRAQGQGLPRLVQLLSVEPQGVLEKSQNNCDFLSDCLPSSSQALGPEEGEVCSLACAEPSATSLASLLHEVQVAMAGWVWGADYSKAQLVAFPL